MTKHISDLDPYTVRHLNVWLDNQVREYERDAMRACMLQLTAEDEEYWCSQGWMRVYEVARRII